MSLNIPKTTLCLQKDREELIAFYDSTPQHWHRIRTSDPIESTFVTIRHRTKRSKGCLSRDGMLHMIFKLWQYAEKKWRRLRSFDYLAKVVTRRQQLLRPPFDSILHTQDLTITLHQDPRIEHPDLVVGRSRFTEKRRSIHHHFLKGHKM